jgi:MauM/NapG family ferredoxin protein
LTTVEEEAKAKDKEAKKLQRERWKQMRQRWTLFKRVRQLVQFALLALFLYLIWDTTQKGVESLPVNLFSRFDPLMAVVAMIGSKSFIANMIPGLLTIVATLILGRFWCGWICPLGTVLDQYGPRVTEKIPSWFRNIKYFLLFAFLFAAVLGSLALMWMDPITIFVRPLAGAVFPAILQKRAPVALMEGLQTARALEVPLRPLVYPLLAVPLLIVLALNIFARRFWCRYLCPLGAWVALVSKFSLFKGFRSDACTKCKQCVKQCPMNTIESTEFLSDPGECLQCLSCHGRCPVAAISIKSQTKVGFGQSYDPNRRQMLASVVAGVGGTLLLRTDNFKNKYPYLVRPPGATESDFLAKCIRCGQCIKVCPNNALHLTVLEGGIESLWSPMLIPRIGNCNWDCNACGQVCPTQAIPKLSLEEKRKAQMGTAVVTYDLCIRCLLCIPACPVEGTLVQATVEGLKGKYPHVDASLCIGCGICEFICPIPGEAAIRVEAPPKTT